MKRKKKNYSRPKKKFESERIKEENDLKKRYGLKNKREIWKTLAKVNYFRGRAKELAKLPPEEQGVLFDKLNALGLKVSNTADVLGLQVEDLLKRRLSTILSVKGLAFTPKHGRQLVVHKNVLIDGKVMDAPSYLVRVAEEKLITVKKSLVKKTKPKVEEVKDAEVAKEEIEEKKSEEKIEEVKEEKAE